MAFRTLGARVAETPLASARFRAVIAVALFIMLGFGLIVPTLPLFARRFGVGDAGVGLLITVFAATRLVGDLFAGGLIDRYGERAMAGLGAAIVGVSSVAAGAAPNYPLLVAFRGAGGVGSALFLGAMLAYLIGTVPAGERGRAMGIFQTVVGIGFLLGPLFGGLVAGVGDLNTPLYVYGAICLVAAPLVLRAMSAEKVPASALAESPDLADGHAPPPPRIPAWRRLRPLLADSAYRAALVTTATTFLTVGAIQTLVPAFWEEGLGRSASTVGVPFTLHAAATLAVIWHAGGLSDRRGRKAALVPALALSTVGIALLGTATSAVALVGLMAVLGVASGYTRPGPTAIVGDVAPAGARGAAVAGYRTAGDIGALVGPIMAGVIAESVGRGAAFLAVAGFVALAWALVVAARETAPSRTVAAPEPS